MAITLAEFPCISIRHCPSSITLGVVGPGGPLAARMVMAVCWAPHGPKRSGRCEIILQQGEQVGAERRLVLLLTRFGYMGPSEVLSPSVCVRVHFCGYSRSVTGACRFDEWR